MIMFAAIDIKDHFYEGVKGNDITRLKIELRLKPELVNASRYDHIFCQQVYDPAVFICNAFSNA